MTARQLRDLLNTLPDEALDLPAIAEGCDCEDDVGCIIVREQEPAVVIGRCDSPHHRTNYGHGFDGKEYTP